MKTYDGSTPETKVEYNSVSKWLHWLMAVGLITMFALGLWISDMEYDNPWYLKGPALHKAGGILMFLFWAMRVLWKNWGQTKVVHDIKPWERKLALGVQHLFYLLIPLLVVSGYFIATADGRPLSVWGLFDIPALVSKSGLEETAGEIHEMFAFSLIALVVLHAAAALKHHFIDKDGVLLSMLPNLKKRKSNS